MSFEVIELGGMKTVSTQSACNHVYVVDVSGSMNNSLHTIRQHLKNIIGVVAQPQDTFSLIYFSGKGQSGVVFESVPVTDLATVTALQQAIDRYITPIGLTGFVDPLSLAMGLDLDASKLNNFIMLTDGYDNQSNRQDIFARTADLKQKYQSITFLEYGFYADRELLSQMAESVDGIHVFADGVFNYERVIEEAVKGVARVQNVEVKTNKRAKHCVYIYNGSVRIVSVDKGVASVPEDVERVYSIVPGDVLAKKLSEEHLFLVAYYAAKTGNNDLVWKCLEALGDVNLFNLYSNAFTKQELSKFEEVAHQAAVDPTQRFLNGKNVGAVPNKNTPTIVDLLYKLEGADAVLVTDSVDWEYNKTSRGTKSSGEELPRFVQSPMSRVSLRGLVFNSERPNISIGTTLNGVVELPDNEFGLERIPSLINRNYTIIKDGIRNMEKLPVLINKAVDYSVFPHTLMERHETQDYVVFDLSKIPVVNRQSVQGVRLEEFVAVVESLEVLKADLKVLNAMIKESGESASKIAGLSAQYGEDAAKWLSTVGVRDYGFSKPGGKVDDVTDEYESIQVVYKIKGLSSLPTIAAVNKKVSEKKNLNAGDQLMFDAIKKFEDCTLGELEASKVGLLPLKRAAEAIVSSMVYALVLGRQWFSDDEVVSTEIELIGNKYPMTIEKVRKLIKV